MTQKPQKQMTMVEVMREFIKISPFTTFMAPDVRVCENGFCEVVVPLRKELTQSHGYAHGAVVSGVADVVSAGAAASLVGRVVTGEFKINFMEPAVGQALVGRSRVLKALKRLVVCQTEIYAVNEGRENLVAAALVTMMPVKAGDFKLIDEVRKNSGGGSPSPPPSD